MAMRSAACRSASDGAELASVRPAAAAFWTARRRSARSAAEAAPVTSAPRRGALAGVGEAGWRPLEFVPFSGSGSSAIGDLDLPTVEVALEELAHGPVDHRG